MGEVDFDGHVDYQEALAIRVGRFLTEDGFGVCDAAGMERHTLAQASKVGVLWNNPETKPRKRLFGLIRRPVRREFIGIIWFDSRVRNANEQNWVFEGYGVDRSSLIRELAGKLSREFDVNVRVVLVRDQPRVELNLEDYDMYSF